MKIGYNNIFLMIHLVSDLGDLRPIERERRQVTGGRLDILLKDDESDTLYEVEVMLGRTDESHIIRAIEYWDLECRKNPHYNHVAVIIAEDITNRFFNVISLLNKSIPIIAIKIHSSMFEQQLAVDFIKILDLSDQSDIDDLEEGEQAKSSRGLWESKSNKDSIAIVDRIISLCKENNINTDPVYNKYHIAMSSSKLNFCWIHPRKKPYCLIDVKVGEENVPLVEDDLKESSIEIKRIKRRPHKICMKLNRTLIEEEKDNVLKVLKYAYSYCNK